jgi:TRAP-type C4-dicarboxylate transport system substrate-binding protein
MCRGDVTTIEDMKGLKIRGSGGGVNIIELIGATPVSMPPSEATSALERGTIDCVLGAVAWLRSYGYMDDTDSVIEAPMGMGGPPMMMYVNRGVWEGLTPEQRQAHIDAAPDLVTLTTYDAQMALDDEVKEDALAAGVTFHEGGEPFDAIMAQRDEIQYGLNADNARNAGVENPEAILDAYLAAYDKWKALIAENGDDRDTFRQLLWDEVYSKVDPEAL